VRRDMGEIAGTNARLEDLRDATTRIRGFYSDLWLRENRPYWLGNVQLRYDRMALIYEDKIEAVKRAGQQFSFTGALPAPESLGFFTPPPPPPPGTAAPGAATPPPAAQTPATQAPVLPPPTQPPTQPKPPQ
jgi:hexosaminidase